MSKTWEFRCFVGLSPTVNLAPLDPIVKRITERISGKSSPDLETLLATHFSDKIARTDDYYVVQSTDGCHLSGVGLKLRGSKNGGKWEVKTRKAEIPGLRHSLERWKKEKFKGGDDQKRAITDHLLNAGLIPMDAEVAICDFPVAVNKRRIDTTIDGCLVTLDKLEASRSLSSVERVTSSWFSISIESTSHIDCQRLMRSLGILEALDSIEGSMGSKDVVPCVMGGYPSFASHILMYDAGDNHA
jgi:hypothetical protein